MLSGSACLQCAANVCVFGKMQFACCPCSKSVGLTAAALEVRPYGASLKTVPAASPRAAWSAAVLRKGLPLALASLWQQRAARSTLLRRQSIEHVQRCLLRARAAHCRFAVKESEMSSRPVPLLALVVPCYNERRPCPAPWMALAELLARCKAEGLSGPKVTPCMWMTAAATRPGRFLRRVMRLIRSAGRQLCGQRRAPERGLGRHGDSPPLGADCIISLDADLQDDINASPKCWRATPKARTLSTACAMTAVRIRPSNAGTAHFFYRLMGWLNVRLIPDHADYRLASRPCWRRCKVLRSKRFFCAAFSPRWASKLKKSIIPASRVRPAKASTRC